jgi:hypothetical protein
VRRSSGLICMIGPMFDLFMIYGSWCAEEKSRISHWISAKLPLKSRKTGNILYFKYLTSYLQSRTDILAYKVEPFHNDTVQPQIRLLFSYRDNYSTIVQPKTLLYVTNSDSKLKFCQFPSTRITSVCYTAYQRHRDR